MYVSLFGYSAHWHLQLLKQKGLKHTSKDEEFSQIYHGSSVSTLAMEPVLAIQLDYNTIIKTFADNKSGACNLEEICDRYFLLAYYNF